MLTDMQVYQVDVAMQASHWTDEELDNFKYEYLKEKHQ